MAEHITHRSHSDRGGFAIERDDERVALLTYSIEDETVVILHTEVDDAIRGTGAGQQLVNAAVQWARREGFKVMPVCSFAKAVISKTNEYDDVL
jgi:hypothetical protein